MTLFLPVLAIAALSWLAILGAGKLYFRLQLPAETKHRRQRVFQGVRQAWNTEYKKLGRGRRT
jgi:hypothetical protein